MLWIGILIAAGALIAWLIPNEKQSALEAKATHRTGGYEGEVDVYEVQLDGSVQHRDDWVKIGRSSEVKGLNKNREAVARFFEKLSEPTEEIPPHGLVVEREPDNAYDCNALAIFAWAGSPASKEFVGYAPKSVAAKVAEFSSDMPIAAKAVQFKAYGQALYLKFDMLAPNAASRRKNGWQTES